MAEQRDRLQLVPLRKGTVADYAATLKRVLESHPIDVVILPMAVADFEPEPYAGKISSDRESLVVQCRRTPKVIRLVRDWAPRSTWSASSCCRASARDELIRRAPRSPARQPCRPDGRQRSADAARGAAHAPPGPAGRDPKRSSPAPTWPSGWSTGSCPGPLDSLAALRHSRTTREALRAE